MMSKLPEMPALEEALEEDSWSWLETNAPKLAAAVREEVGRGAGIGVFMVRTLAGFPARPRRPSGWPATDCGLRSRLRDTPDARPPGRG